MKYATLIDGKGNRISVVADSQEALDQKVTDQEKAGGWKREKAPPAKKPEPSKFETKTGE